MKLFIVLLSTLALKFGFQNGTPNYSLKSPPNSILQQKKLANGGFLDVYVSKSNEEGFRYTITIGLMGSKEKGQSVFDKTFKQEYLKGCNCTISSSQKAAFGNVEGVLFEMSKTESGVEYMYYSFNTLRNDRLLNVIYMTTIDKFSTYEEEFKDIMETFEVL